ncbi:MAG: hypothetical protein ACKO2P_12750 [Planctomycetota bacterium]
MNGQVSVHRSLCLLATILLSGCTEKPAWEVTHPATGLLTFRGKPVADADIVLFPQDPAWPGTVRPRARTKADGTFAVWTWEPGDGAPAGTYKATLIHNEIGESKGAVVAKPNDLPPKYERPDSSDLQITIVTGENQIPPIAL